MPIRKTVREQAFQLARRDLAEFLSDHKDDLIQIFREEIELVDDQIPEESFFIDIKMAPLGEVILEAALHAIIRFLSEDIAEKRRAVQITVRSEDDKPSLILKNIDT
jgi:hypothetical protein